MVSNLSSIKKRLSSPRRPPSLKPLGYLNICLNFAVSYEYTRGHYAGEAHQSGPRVVREAGVNPAQYPLL